MLPLLPRDIESDPARDTIRARLAAHRRRLWSGGRTLVPTLPLAPALAAALAQAGRDGHLVVGLERAEETLAGEARGIGLAARAGGRSAATRVSRLLLLSDDAAERLYRHVDALAIAHAPRLLVIVLATSAETIGHLVTDRDAKVKAVLVQHKATVSALLRTLVA